MDVPTPEAPHVLSWTAPVGGPVAEYYVYCDPYGNGTFGFLGTATGMTTFRDIGYVPDFATTPPLPHALFQTEGTFRVRRLLPAAALLREHRPQPGRRLWIARPVPVQLQHQLAAADDDALTFRIAGNQHNPVRHLIGLKTLVVS